jgi:hypothetical protein
MWIIAHILKKESVMRTHEFTMILTAVPTDAKAEEFYGICNDATLAIRAGVGRISFHRSADSLEDALRSALSDVATAGLTVRRVEMEPDAVLMT